MNVGKERGVKLTVQPAVDPAQLHQPRISLLRKILELVLDRGKLEPGVLRALLQFLGFLDPELLLLGKALLQLGVAALRLLELGLQPEYLVLLFLEIGLVLNSASNLAILQFGCVNIPGLACEVDADIREK